MNTRACILILMLIELTWGAGPPNPDPTKASRRLAPCQACRALVTSFLRGMEKTNKGHYGGGDTAWEEENKKVYKNSELRLVEIHEGLCSDVTIGKDQCHELSSEHEDALEEWWNNYRNAGEDLLSWLCVSKLKVCCPEHHFGHDCLPCVGAPSNICSQHGKCKGDGTRKGNGDCICDTGYAAKLCDTCAKDYYEAFREEGKFLCSACHRACQGGCTGPGPKQCNACSNGWDNDEERGCLDFNECLMDESPCKFSEFCVNSEGSYKCIGCDKSCEGCFGDGPDMCEKCASGFVLKNKMCIDDSTAGRSLYLSTTRYLTYLGLCLATCIIFQKNMAIASVIGITVAIYISASEYLLTTTADG